MQPPITELLITRTTEMHEWLSEQEAAGVPFYASVDLRDSGEKVGIVDTNLFPAGFNNISKSDWPEAQQQASLFFKNRNITAKDLLIICEEHTRNKWYIDNVFCLKQILEGAGYRVHVATFLNPELDHVCQNTFSVNLDSQSFGPLSVYCLKYVLDAIDSGTMKFDAVIYNNDLSEGFPTPLQKLSIPCFPSGELGWHRRRKSQHFLHANQIIDSFCSHFKLDPWRYQARFEVVEHADINLEADRERLAGTAEKLFIQLKQDHLDRGIKDAPRLFLKSDTGTYGMGVVAIGSPEDILNLNRKARNNLAKGKGSQVIDHFILQEGIPTSLNVDNAVAEPCLYMINNSVIGAFYRCNDLKSSTENLNSQGMRFLQIALKDTPEIFKAYQILARLSGLAAAREAKDVI